ncbi:NB-ARC domains-containing protein [Tanacetum coccineum]
MWNSSEVYRVLSEKKVPMTEAIEVLVVLLRKSSQTVHINADSFTPMKKLRILKIYAGADIHRRVDLKGYNVKRLKVMKLRHCCNLTTTPDFSEITNLEKLDLEGCVNLVTIHPSIGMLKRLVVLNMRDCRRAMSCLNVNQVPEAFWSRWWTTIPGFIWNQQHPQRSVSLECLHMLTSLNFSYCNLVQVPESIGGLSFLKKLNLEGNSFTSLPGSLSQLSHLKRLRVDGCKKLEVLQELPHSLESVKARSCTSLSSITGSNPIMTKRSTYLSNCPKLFKNHVIESQVSISDTECLDSYVTSQGSTNRFSSFLRYACIQNNRRGFFRLPGSSIDNMDMIYKGNNIPNWFTNKSMGNQVKVELPLDWSFSKLRGYGICVVFKRKKPFGYSVKNFDGASLGGCFPYYHREYFEGKPIRVDESDMIWLHYTTREIWKWKEAKNFVTFCFYEDEDIEVKEMGVRLVCDEQVDLSMFQDLPTLSPHGGGPCACLGIIASTGHDDFVEEIPTGCLMKNRLRIDCGVLKLRYSKIINIAAVFLCCSALADASSTNN